MDSNLDVLIYAHDGRGLGHVSRSVGIGLALRRLYPELSVLLITGCSTTAELIGDGSLDWIKLPSYKTNVTAGKSSGVKGDSNIDDKLLGELRAQNIRDIIEAYKPKVFLADHTPQGKHKELLPSHDVSPETVRVLGIRAVVGEVGKVWSDFSADVFAATYSNIFWYGDSSVAGAGELERLNEHYGVKPHEVGYVSRLSELRFLNNGNDDSSRLAGVISVPWSGEGSSVLLDKLAQALGNVDVSHGDWKIYMNMREREAMAAVDSFNGLEHVRFEQVGPQFLSDLRNSRSAVIYGGYNSLTDVMVCNVPSLVLLRGMKDGEQEDHAAVLAGRSSAIQNVFSDQTVTVEELRESLLKCLNADVDESLINLDGAENAARYLAELAGGCSADR
ncbi:hypothetical protein [Maridesulfovibrio salexigens]|uniref:Glycosyl transferase family 28 C-terminal domain-containing protein n=1 Tax=Maridesulfovibrio salexigens (strain ATCC 14822 / DSM 2638 / NCIMB 8403 / VKM B-1763) TaxID=526222 RepID=C6BTP9_MARSD|nr:hypothetical protein [Maridesulfovibrio salexigens]ACS79829.1 conserved hypothetical protein [Maridesulfovibrio salexigens DSM 2638]